MKSININNIDSFFQTQKEQIVNSVCSSTGLDTNSVEQLYESRKNLGYTPDEIKKYFDQLNSKNEYISSVEIINSFNNLVTKIEDDVDSQKLVETILSTLSDYTLNTESHVMLSDIDTLKAVEHLLLIKNDNASKFFSQHIGLEEAKDLTGFAKLNESLNINEKLSDFGPTIKLYEGLKEILNKNNPRWGHAYRLTNVHNTIMAYIEKETEEIILKQKLYSSDTTFHLSLINDVMSGVMNPMYGSASAIKSLVPDTQTLTFDIVLLIYNFFAYNKYSNNFIDFVNRNTVEGFENSANTFVSQIISSRLKSRILHDDFIKKLTDDDCSEKFEYSQGLVLNHSLVGTLSSNIDTYKLKYNSSSISLKGIKDLIYIVKSLSGEFNLGIRPSINLFVTKSLELTDRYFHVLKEQNRLKK